MATRSSASTRNVATSNSAPPQRSTWQWLHSKNDPQPAVRRRSVWDSLNWWVRSGKRLATDAEGDAAKAILFFKTLCCWKELTLKWEPQPQIWGYPMSLHPTRTFRSPHRAANGWPVGNHWNSPHNLVATAYHCAVCCWPCSFCLLQSVRCLLLSAMLLPASVLQSPPLESHVFQTPDTGHLMISYVDNQKYHEVRWSAPFPANSLAFSSQHSLLLTDVAAGSESLQTQQRRGEKWWFHLWKLHEKSGHRIWGSAQILIHRWSFWPKLQAWRSRRTRVWLPPRSSTDPLVPAKLLSYCKISWDSHRFT